MLINKTLQPQSMLELFHRLNQDYISFNLLEFHTQLLVIHLHIYLRNNQLLCMDYLCILVFILYLPIPNL